MNLLKKIYLTIISVRNLPTFILDHAGYYKNRDVLYKFWNTISLICRGSSSDINESIIINSDLEYPQKYFPKEKGSTIIDLGANIGAFSIYINKVLHSQKPYIYAVEPSKNNFKYLKKNMLLNHCSNITCFNIAISDRTGYGYLDVSKGYDSFSLIEKSDLSGKTERVKLSTLDSFCKKNNLFKIELLKIDIEGAEYLLFKKSLPFIKKHVISIFVEVHHVNNYEYVSFKKLLNNNHFQIIDIIEKVR